MSDGVKILLFSVLSFVIIILALGTFANWLEQNSCEARWRDSGLESRYSFWTECQVRVRDQWIPAENYREM